MSNAFLAPNARWQGRDSTGQPAAGGKLYTYANQTTDPKITWSDYQRVNPNTNPVTLDSKGEANIYWDDDNLYSIILTDSNDTEIYSQDNYPVVGEVEIEPVIELVSVDNLVRNPQFTFWSNSDNFPAISQSGNPYDYIADDWVFFRSNLNATINITRQLFNLGQTDVPASPVSYLRYECTNTGSGAETFKYIGQYYNSVQSLNSKNVSVAIYARSTSSSPLTISFQQFFGTGGSPSASVETIALTAELTATWTRYTATIMLPDVEGKTLGTNGDDALIMQINLPLNAVGLIEMVNVQSHQLDDIVDFPYLTQDEQYKKLNSAINAGVARTGDFKHTLRVAADPGWVVCDDGTLGDSSSGATNAALYTKALYKLVWDGVSNVYAPVYNSDGTVGTRGSTAYDDYNAHKRIALTKALGRVLSGTAPSGFTISKIFTAAVDPDNKLTFDNTTSFFTGKAVTLTTTGTLPAPLATSTTYYAILIDNTHIKLAASKSDALAATPVPISLTNTGTGIHTIIISFNTVLEMGEYIGEIGHSQTINELAPHNHNPSYWRHANGTAGGSGTPIALPGTTSPQVDQLDILMQGNGDPFNIIQPTLYLNTMIKL